MTDNDKTIAAALRAIHTKATWTWRNDYRTVALIDALEDC